MKKLSTFLPVFFLLFVATSSLQACNTKGTPDLNDYEEQIQDKVRAGLAFLFMRDNERHIPKEGLETRNLKKVNGWEKDDHTYVMEISYDLTLIKEPSELGKYAGSKRGTLRDTMKFYKKGDSRNIKQEATFRKTEKGWQFVSLN